ncbi:MAG: hypothetical protein ILA19_03645 [Bacilli bacterium]|nr:hypothetical protein [Bacilli bacterium]
MKEASGELNMTVITIVAIAAIAALFAFLWPGIKNSISNQWNSVGNDMNTVHE